MFSLNITAPSSYYYRFIDITFFIFNLFPIFVNGMSNKTGPLTVMIITKTHNKNK